MSNGKNEVVAVADAGFDKDSTVSVHPAFPRRVIKLCNVRQLGKFDGPHGRGTDVSESIVGDSNSSSVGGTIQGTAPIEGLTIRSWIDKIGGVRGIPTNLRDLFNPPQGSH